MYTHIPLKDLCDKVDRVIDPMKRQHTWGKQDMNGCWKLTYVSQAKWTECKQTSYKKRSKICIVPDLKALVSLVVFNTFVCNHGSVLNQHLGMHTHGHQLCA